MRLVNEVLVAAADKREAVPEEALRLAAVVRRRKLPVGVISPTNAQLGAAANWMIAVDPKLIPLVKIVTKG